MPKRKERKERYEANECMMHCTSSPGGTDLRNSGPIRCDTIRSIFPLWIQINACFFIHLARLLSHQALKLKLQENVQHPSGLQTGYPQDGINIDRVDVKTVKDTLLLFPINHGLVRIRLLKRNRLPVKPEFGGNVIDGPDQMCALPEQMMGALTLCRINPAWHGKDLPALIKRQAGSDQGPGLQSRLNHDNTMGQTADNTIAGRKTKTVRTRSAGILTEQDTVAGNPVIEILVGSGIHDIKTAAKNTCSHPTCCKGTLMGPGINTQCNAGDNNHALTGQTRCQPVADITAIGGGGTGSDKSNARLLQTG